MTTYVGYNAKVNYDGNQLPDMEVTPSEEISAIEDTNKLSSGGYKTYLAGLKQWGLSVSGKLSSNAGYLATVKKGGTPTSTTAEACTLVSGKTYQINDTAKRVWDESVAPVVYDGGVDHTSDVDSIDYLYGKVTFDSGYTVTGAVTVDVDYVHR